MTSQAPVLIPDPGRPSTPVLGVRFVRSEVQIAIKQFLGKLGLIKLSDILPSDWAVPDSVFAQHALEYAQTLCPEYMITHSFRAYCFGAILAARNGLNLDREVFFVAAMLHDLGLSDQYKSEPGSFEWVGAKLAHQFCVDDDQSEFVAATIHNSIALHTSVGVAGREAPEIALLHYGTGMDLFGMRVDEIPPDSLVAILDKYPRTDFKPVFSRCLTHQAEIKPDSQIAGAVGIGICDRIKAELP